VNLHSLWDTAFVDLEQGTSAEIAARIQNGISSEDRQQWQQGIPAVSGSWCCFNGLKLAFGHPVGLFFLTAAEAEWEGVLYAMRWIDRDNPK
jgi:hypothetical protein